MTDGPPAPPPAGRSEAGTPADTLGARSDDERRGGQVLDAQRRATLGRALEDLGGTLLELVQGDPDRAPEIGGIVIHDPLDESPVLPAGAVVLAVGVRGTEAIAALLAELGAKGAAALVVRSPVERGPVVADAVQDSGVALLGLTRGSTWAQLAALLRVLLGEGDVGSGEPERLGGLLAGDLFALANAIAALLDAPVTIEDRSNRVLAFSGRQDEADPGRIATVLGLQVPEHYSRVLEERGVFRELFRSDRPVTMDPVVPDEEDGGAALPRAAIAVRAGAEILGSIWVVLRRPLGDRAEILVEAAKLAALHMLRLRAGADVERRLRTELVTTALEGGSGGREALARLGMAGQPLAVMAIGVLDPVAEGSDAPAGLANELHRLRDAFALHLSAVHPRSSAAVLGSAIYGLVPLTRTADDGEEFALRIAEDFLDRLGERSAAVIGIGPVARDIAGLAHARLAADRTLRVLRDGAPGRRAARLSDVHAAALLMELRDLVASRGDRPMGPVARLTSYDEANNAHLVETLRAWLEAFGDVNAAAAAVFVHPNTFRYRLRRLAEVGQLDLGDPEARFAAHLHLRMLDLDAP